MRYNPKKHRLPIFNANGVLLIDKPVEWTSFDVVNFVRARFNIPKVGHCGTLDPAATGLLVLVLGKFTLLSQKFSGEDKVYEATMRLGLETDSEDMDGQIVAEHDWSQVTEEMLRETLTSFIGVQQQTPPMVSAVKKGGKKLYELARQGVEIERESREITIFSLDISRVELPRCDFLSEADLRGGVLEKLRRLRSGSFDVADALTIEQLKTFEQGDLEAHLRRFLFEKLSRIAGV